MLPVVVLTSRAYHWLLLPFAYLFNVYWSTLQHVIVVTDVMPRGVTLPENFSVVSVSKGRALPKERWSDGLIEALRHIQGQHFVLMLEDYWLVRTVDDRAIPTLAEYCRTHPDILRCDLTDDRQYNGAAYSIGSYGHYDLVETPPDSPYQMSLQAAIWNKDLLLSLLRPELTPWQVELYLSPELHSRPDLRVIGTRQCPVRYANVTKGGVAGAALNVDLIPQEHRQVLEERQWLTPRVLR